MKIFVFRAAFPLLFLALLCFTKQPVSVQAQSDKVIFAVIGDYGLAGQNEADVANLVKSWAPDFIVTVGDNNYPGGGSSSIDQNIGQYYHDFIFPYNGKYGNGAATRRFFPTLGNHDWGETGAKPYFNYFSFYNEKTYYDFIQGSVHFFILDSDRNEPDGITSTSPQAKWLKKVLTASTSPFNVILLHHSPYSSGRHGSYEYMQWPFKEWGADAVIAGHDHTYERLLVNGLPYFVNGVGGAELYNFEATLPESKVRFNQDFGAMRVEASSTTMKFQMITRAGILVDEYTIGQTNPGVAAITLSGQSPANANSLNFQITFSEAVTGVDISDFTLSTNLSGSAITSLSGSGNTYLVSVNSGTGDGNLRLDLTDNDSITNGIGNPLGGFGLGNGDFLNGQTYLVDRSAPAVTMIARTSPSPTNAASVEYSVIFSEPVSGVDISDFGLFTGSGAQISAVNGSGNSYLVSITTNSGDDAVRLDFIDNDSVIDPAGNAVNGGVINGETYTIDRSAPFVTSIVRGPNASSVEYTVSFSEAVNGVDGGDFFLSSINGAAISNVTGFGNVYTISIAARPGNDSIRLDLIDDDSIFDNIGNRLGDVGIANGNFTNGETVTISQDVPIVTSILRASPNPANAASVDFIVTFSGPVEGVDISDFFVTGINNAAILNISNVNPFYIVTVDASSGEGVLKLDLIDDDSIHDLDGISLGGDGIGNANYTLGESFSIDRTPPHVTSIMRASNNPTINPAVDFIITFSEAVNGVDAADLFVTTTNLNSFITNFQNSDPFYLVTVSTGAGSGTLRLDLKDNDSITDLAGNKLAINDNNSGSFKLGESYTIAKITVNFPAPNISNINRKPLTNDPTPSLSWSTVRNAQAYEIFIAQDINFSQLTLIQTTSQSNLSPDLPLMDGAYYMRVRAYNPDLLPGKFSKTISFTIDTTPPSAPRLVSPPDHSTSLNRPLLQWEPAYDANQYQVEVDNDPAFSSPEFTDTTNKNSIRSRSLAKGIAYYWRVRARDKSGNWSNWSPIFSVSIP